MKRIIAGLFTGLITAGTLLAGFSTLVSADDVSPDEANPWRELARKPWEDPHINEPAQNRLLP